MLPISCYGKNSGGLVRACHNLIEEKPDRNWADRDELVIGSIKVKLDLLFWPSPYPLDDISYPFRQRLSKSLSEDEDPNIVWVTVQKSGEQFRIRKDVLRYLSAYFAALYDGQQPAPEDDIPSIELRPLKIIFGQYATTGIYRSETCLRHDRAAAVYLEWRNLNRNCGRVDEW
jgi:hypothetical protein